MSVPKTMRALAFSKITAAHDAELSVVDVPELKPGWLSIQVQGFGLNHSEQMLREGEILEDYIVKPCVPGIECVGVVADPGDTSFAEGDVVCALMGGMGRNFWGGYAEYCAMPAHHVFRIDERLIGSLSWAELAAIPETYHTAWGSLFESLHLQRNDVLLVRGATCALGYAAIQLARAEGARIVATTHRASRMDEVESLIGDDDTALLDDGSLAHRLREEGVTKALELVGPVTLRDTLRGMHDQGIVCSVGVLGGAESIPNFDPIFDIRGSIYLTTFYSNAPTEQGMAELFDFMVQHGLRPHVGAQYDFEHAVDALIAQDEGGVKGKIVVTREEGEE